MKTSPKGFTLLVAVILSTVVLTVGLSLLDHVYKQNVISSTVRQSEIAFYNADSAMECALYFDQKFNYFDFLNPTPLSVNDCHGMGTTVGGYSSIADAQKRTTIFNILSGGGTIARVTVVKTNGVTFCEGTKTTCIYTQGLSSSAPEDIRKIERGLKVLY